MSNSDPPRDWTGIDQDEESQDFVEMMEEVGDELMEEKRERHGQLNPSTGDHILDVGCGVGVDVRMLAERVGDDGLVVGVDNSMEMIDAARERVEGIPSARIEQDDAADLSFPDDTFDAARAERVLIHLDDPAEALAEMVRVTREGGRISVSDQDPGTWGWESPAGDLWEFLSTDWGPLRNPQIGRHLYLLAKDAGLQDIEVEARAIEWTDFDQETLEERLMLDDWLSAMQNAGEVTEAEAESWLDDLRTYSDRDLVFGFGMSFTMAGTVPE